MGSSNIFDTFCRSAPSNELKILGTRFLQLTENPTSDYNANEEDSCCLSSEQLHTFFVFMAHQNTGMSMNSKPKDKKENLFTAAPTSPNPDAESVTKACGFVKEFTDSMGSYVEELFNQAQDPNYVQVLDSAAPSVRTAGNHLGAPAFAPSTGGESTIWKNFGVTDCPVEAEDLYENMESSTSTDCTFWPETAFSGKATPCKEPMSRPASEIIPPKESLKKASPGVNQFFKDEHRQTLMKAPQLPELDLYTVNILPGSQSFATARTQQLEVAGDHESSHSISSTSSHGCFDRARCLPEANLDAPVAHIPRIKSDPCSSDSLSGDGVLGFLDYAQGSPQHLVMYKSELSIPVRSSESQLWYQSPGFHDHQQQIAYPSPSGIQSARVIHGYPNTYSSYLGVLPQKLCMICGDEASGCHYGVLTCGSCKVFFKRAVEGRHNYLCAGRNDCIIDKIRRKNCPACRLRKCYQAGMMLGGRKFKKFGSLKPVGVRQPLVLRSLQPLVTERQDVASLLCVPPIRELELTPQISSILEAIEPEVIYAGYDNSQPDTPNVMLSILNRLCERQLLCIVKWSKSIPGFRDLHIDDQMTLIQYSWMSLMVFAMGWRSYKNATGKTLYFAPDLILNEERMKRSPIYDLCLAMQHIPQEFENLQVTKEEFLCMKTLLLLNTIPLEGLKSQGQFEEMRQNYIRELTKAIHQKEKGVVASSQRFYRLTKLLDAMHDIVKKLNLFCLSTFIQAHALSVEFPEMMSEVIASQLPKILAGMVKPLLFHRK
ncbi:progesterone receptor [Lepisosteus oculatus]|uniref:progesterone receptor n=1 Tax=Lepisosteus oculatus TaxID=7918 RepID=UPI00370FD6D8